MTIQANYITLGAKSSLEYSLHKNEKDHKLIRLFKGVIAFFKGLLGLYKVNVLSETTRKLTTKHPHASYTLLFKDINQRSVKPATPENHLTKMETAKIENDSQDESISSADSTLASESKSWPEKEFSPDFIKTIEILNQYDGENISTRSMGELFNTLEAEVIGRRKSSYSNMLNNFFTTFLHLIDRNEFDKNEADAARVVIAERLINLGFCASDKKNRTHIKKIITNIKGSELYHLKKLFHYFDGLSRDFSKVSELCTTLSQNCGKNFLDKNSSAIGLRGSCYLIILWLDTNLLDEDPNLIKFLKLARKVSALRCYIPIMHTKEKFETFLLTITNNKKNYSRELLHHYRSVLDELIHLTKYFQFTLTDEQNTLVNYFMSDTKDTQ